MRPNPHAVAVLLVLCAPSVFAAATDCIKDGGQMICTEPIIKSETIGLCDEAGTYLWLERIKQDCAWGQPTPTLEAAKAKAECFANGVTGCGGARASGSWSQPGETYTSWLCWNITTSQKNGIPFGEFARINGTAIYKDDQGNCTKSGGFPYSIVAAKWRDIGCPEGYNASTLPNGDLRCWKCPPYSTWNGVNCVCFPGFVKDPRTNQCIVACVTDLNCGDQDICNGGDSCVNGLCVKSPPPTCNDNRSCTRDRCDSVKNACVNEVDPLMCKCDPIDVTVKVPAKVKFESPKVVNCPKFLGGGQVSASLGVKGTLEKTFATCANGCQGKTSREIELSVDAKFCGIPKKSTIGGKYTTAERRCPTCDQASCTATCSSGSCETNTYTGELKVEFPTEWKGWQKKFTYGGFGYSIGCAPELSASLTTTLEYEGTAPEGGFAPGPSCAPCTTCQSFSTTVKAGGAAKGDCKITGVSGLVDEETKAPTKKAPGSLCLGCTTLSASASGMVKGGDCNGNGVCGMSRIDGEAKVEIIKADFQYGWFKVAGSCKAFIKGCEETNSCGTCSCKNCSNVESDTGSCSMSITLTKDIKK